jgi:hypothetical protein
MNPIFKKSSFLTLLAGTLLLSSCDPEIDAPAISPGELDLSKYIAVGNSLTAGYSDDGLYLEGQLSSYPNILAGQFRQAGGGDFVQPLFTENQRNGSGYLRLNSFENGSPQIVRTTENLARPANSAFFTDEFAGEVQNFGVPGIRIADIQTPGYGSAQGNPYFERITPDNTALQTYLARVSATTPTFFSLWLGNNDVLGYATAGAAAGSMTEPGPFSTNYSAILNVMSEGGTEGIVATIPDVTGLPFFRTVTLSAVRAAANNAEVYIRINETTVRPATNEDYILLTTQGAIGRPDVLAPGVTIPHGFHPLNPLTDAEVLDKAETEEVQARTSELNTIIKNLAAAKNLAVFDAHAIFNQIQPVNGQPALNLNGIAYSPAFITGNLFSLDGVHPTPRGYAIVANEMIKAINLKYKATIPTVDVTRYRAVLFP